MRRYQLALVLVLAAAVSGCGGGLLGLVDNFDDGNDDDVNNLITLLSREWTVTRYSGSEVGAVDVPEAANMRWWFDSDMTFTVESDQPVSIGGDATRTYAEEGIWEVLSATDRRLALTITASGGAEVPAANRVEVEATAVINAASLVISTAAIGPGTVRYVAVAD